MKITRNTHRTDPLSGKEPEPWCGADRAVVNLAWHDIQLVELVPAFCSSFGASHFPICISGPEPDENCTERTASPGSHGHRTQPFHTELLVPSCSPAATKLAALHRPHSSKFRHDFRIYVDAFKKTTGRPSRDIRMSGPVRFVVDGFRTGIPVTDLPWHGMPSQPM